MKNGLFKLIFIICWLSLSFGVGKALAEEEGVIPDSAPTPVYQKDELYFARLSLSKTRLYLGERVPFAIQLYVGEIRVDEVSPPAPGQPEFDFGPISRNSQVKTEVNGNPYRMIQFNSSMVPLKTGKLTINPISMYCIVVQTVAVTLATGETGYRIIRRTLKAQTPKQTVWVLPLPQKGQPPGFSGGIGNFRLALNLPFAVIRQGDSFTVKLTVSGAGNLSNIGPPQLESSPGFKVFPAQKTGEDRPGRKEFEQVIIPLDDKVKNIGPFILDYFDPDAGKYRQAKATLAVKIKPNPEFQKGQLIAVPGVNVKQGPEPAALKENPGGLRLGGKLLLDQLWFWLLQLIPLAAFLAALYFRNYQRMLQSGSFQARAIKASRRAAARLANAKVLLAEGKSGQLLEELHLILREYLGERFNLPVAGMTEAVVETLKTAGPDLGPEVLAQIHKFFTGYAARRFAGGALLPEEGAGLWEEVKGIIEALNRYRA